MIELYNRLVVQKVQSFQKLFRILLIALVCAIAVVALKYVLHTTGFEPIEQSSLHNGVLASATFVIGFLLSATIADYKESERIPAEFASIIEDIYADAESIHKTYPDFDIKELRNILIKIAQQFEQHVRAGTSGASDQIRKLHQIFYEMEKAGVPPNFIVKLKQQQATLLKSRKRTNYIQRIRFIPSATILSRTIVMSVIGLLLFTNIDPFYGGLAILGIISFVLTYMMMLLTVISTPFHESGKTQDDVSLFLLEDAVKYLKSK